MSSIFKKALGLFVEFEPDESKSNNTNLTLNEDGLPMQVRPSSNKYSSQATFKAGLVSQEDIDKFENHFVELFDNANLSGPDYYEFWKMMETLETAVPDETIRMNAVFSTLKIQGLNKDTLIESAEKYLQILDKDKLAFKSAVNKKVLNEIEGRNKIVNDLEIKNQQNSELMQKLSDEIKQNSLKISSVKKEVIDEEAKINANSNGYNIACDAMMAKLGSDLQKIKTSL